jgi:hypothetical protein
VDGQMLEVYEILPRTFGENTNVPAHKMLSLDYRSNQPFLLLG